MFSGWKTFLILLLVCPSALGAHCSNSYRGSRRYYRIVSRLNHKVLNVYGGYARLRTPIIMWPKHNPPCTNELWRFQYIGGGWSYIVTAMNSNLVIDVANGRNLILWRKHGGLNQQFKKVGSHIYSRLGWKVVDILNHNKNNGAKLIIWPKHNGLNQQFYLQRP